jgi:acetoin utilization deacetylase AcuC-like enzyme
VATLAPAFVYHPSYHLNIGEHVFPAAKFRLIAERLERDGLCAQNHLLLPDPATREQLLLAHTPAWVNALLDGTIRYEQVLKLEIPYSQPMVRAFCHHAGGSILAADQALKQGRAFNIGGGFHHAFAAHGEGFCAINDIAVAIRVLQQQGRISRAMVIDTDVHHGNGTASIFHADRSVFTLSIHQENNYPYTKPPSDLDVPLEDGVGDQEYLQHLAAALRYAFDTFQPDLIAYVAGSDPYCQDKLGGLNLSIEGMRQRDTLVIQAATARNIPIFVTLAGGYAANLDDTITLHTNTAHVLSAPA